jgi:hypothetical protein
MNHKLLMENWRQYVTETHSKKHEKELDKISDELSAASGMHQGQADRIDKILDQTEDPPKERKNEGKKNCGCGQDPCITYGIRAEAKNKEGKEQGSDGKACWSGYRHAGTEGGKDRCVKMEEGGRMGHYHPNLETASGYTPEDIAHELIQGGAKLTEQAVEQAVLQAGVLDDDIPDFVDAVIDVIMQNKGSEMILPEGDKRGLWDNIHAKRKEGRPAAKKGEKGYPKTLDIEESMISQIIIEEFAAILEKKKKKKSAAWQRKAGKNKEGGLNKKGRESYERENPGSDLKAPTKKKGNKRRKSFCARMKGMKKKNTSAKTARDPDSRINKSLRKWDC